MITVIFPKKRSGPPPISQIFFYYFSTVVCYVDGETLPSLLPISPKRVSGMQRRFWTIPTFLLSQAHYVCILTSYIYSR